MDYYRTIQCDTIQYNTIQYNTIQYNTIQYNTLQYKTINNYIYNDEIRCKTMIIIATIIIYDVNINAICSQISHELRFSSISSFVSQK